MSLLENPMKSASATVQSRDLRLQWTASVSRARLSYYTPDLLELDFSLGTRLTLPLVHDILDEFSARCEHKTGRLLVYVSRISSVDAEVVRAFSKITSTMRVALLGFGPADRVLTKFFMRNHDPQHPCAYVEERGEALDFLYAA
ncbi:MAG: hypothetical protein Q4P23_12405 [Micrococcaceae bacterium]|nr:hypothetical protein [Micrococcaceae bacterium]